ncbi:MAG: hypothetical protein IPK13_19960 [Deltaproteobacteria bacterium]|nr:hypothetical protein [Deltaproteobacteria bacterium]
MMRRMLRTHGVDGRPTLFRGPRLCGWAVLAVATAGLGATALGADTTLVEKLDHGQVDWSDRAVIATGSGAPNLKLPTVAAVRLNAERAAKLDALRNVVETLKGVQITTANVGATELERGSIKAQVQGLLKGCKTVDTRYYSDGGVDVVVRCPLDGGLATVLAPSQSKKDVSTEGAADYTGLVVDATGLKLRPALAPRIVDDAGHELYVQEMVGSGALRQRGATGYAISLEAAQRDSRVGKTPLVIKASALGQKPGELIVNVAEAKKLEGKNLSFLTEARVVIAMDAL